MPSLFNGCHKKQLVNNFLENVTKCVVTLDARFNGFSLTVSVEASPHADSAWKSSQRSQGSMGRFGKERNGEDGKGKEKKERKIPIFLLG